jgi:hypothetical protein
LQIWQHSDLAGCRTNELELSTLQTLQSDAEACQAAVKAAELIRSAASAGTPVDEAALQQAMVEQQRALKEAAEVRQSCIVEVVG